MILLLALLAHADPVALRAPASGDVVAVAGAPYVGAAWRYARDDKPTWTVGAALRSPSAAVDVSLGLSTHHGPDRGWGWAGGTSVGVLALRGPGVGLSSSTWLRVERRGALHGGAQLALPLETRVKGGLRLPALVELFAGSQRGRISVVAMGGLGWALIPGTGSGALVAQGTLQVGVGRRPSPDAVGSGP